MQRAATFECPNCHQIDQVRKASAIIHSAHMNEQNLYTKLEARAPGPPPDVHTGKGSSSWSTGCTVICGLVILYFVVATLYSISIDETGGVGSFVFNAVSILVFGGIGFYAWSSNKPEHHARLRSESAAKRSEWDRKVVAWDRTYYCDRCGVTYVAPAKQ